MTETTLGQVSNEIKETCKGEKAGLPVVGLEHLIPEEVTLTQWDENVENTFTKQFSKGDMLFGRRRAYLKKAALAPFDGICSGDITVIRAKPECISPDLLPFIIQSDDLFDYAVGKSAGSLSPRVKWEHLKGFKLRLPEISEQEKLAEILWGIEETRNAYKKLIAATDELVKSQFIEMFGLPEKNVHGYDEGTIADVVQDVHYGTSAKAADKGQYTYLRMNNITYDGQLDLSDIKYIDVPEKDLKGCLVQCGDVLFNRTNSRELVGKTCAFMESQPMIIAGYIIRLRMNGKVLPKYLSIFMNLKRSKDLLFSMAKGAVGQANINAQEVQSIPLLIPPMEYQMEFERLTEQSDKSKFALLHSLIITQVLQKALSWKLCTFKKGRIYADFY